MRTIPALLRLALPLTLVPAVALTDALVSRLVSSTPLDRTVKVLEAVGPPPHAHDVWSDHLDMISAACRSSGRRNSWASAAGPCGWRKWPRG